MKFTRAILFLTFCFSILFSFCANAQEKYNPIVKKSIFYGKSKAIRDVKIVLPGLRTESKEVEANPLVHFRYDKTQISGERLIPENVQDYFGTREAKSPALNFEGVGNMNGSWPADPNGDVGLNHYVQTVNSSIAVWDKSGNLLYGPVDYRTIWESFPGPWYNLLWCDPVFIYDVLADRWVFTSMSVNLNQEMYYEMLAVSVSPDPLGEYYCYAYEFENINDYPKMSVWPNGYYINYNIFEYNGSWIYLNSLITAVDRQAMLNGEEDAVMVQFILESSEEEGFNFSPLTSNYTGLVVPENPVCYAAVVEIIPQGNPWDLNISLFEIQPDWLNPDNSTFDTLSQIDIEGTISLYEETGAPQPGNFHNVEVFNLASFMYPLVYKNFVEYESMVACQPMWDGQQYYIRWFEFRKDNSDWYIYQTGNYMPDTASRYTPSISINGNGDIGMVYTKSSLDIYPTMCFTGRRAGDSLGIMTINEMEIFKGLNYVNNYTSDDNRNRWGDYASMSVDPANDSTFWFTSMYPKKVASAGNWATRIVALNLSETDLQPYAFAGNDTTIEPTVLFVTSGAATNYNALEWSTTGDGTFLTNGVLNAKYVRGDQDINNGKVQLILQANGYEPGSVAVDTMTLTIDTETGFEDLESNALELSINPNPSNGIVLIKANTGIHEKVTLWIYDSQGKQLFTEEIITTTQNYTRKVDFSLKEVGIYFCRLQVGVQVANEKVVLIR